MIYLIKPCLGVCKHLLAARLAFTKSANDVCLSSLFGFLNWLPKGHACLLSLLVGTTSTLLLSDLLPLLYLQLAILTLALWAWRRPYALLLLFFTIGFSNAVWQFADHKSRLLPKAYERVDIVVTGTVSTLPTARQGDIKFRFLVKEFAEAELAHLSGTKLQLTCYRCPFLILSGETWQFTVRLKRPHGFASAGAFDFQKYLFRHQIVGRGSVRTKHSNALIKSATLNTNKFRQILRSQLDEIAEQDQPNSIVGHGLIRALVIGDKSGITADQNQVLQKTGISHLIAISGLHIGLVFACVLALANLLLRPFTRLYQHTSRQLIALFPAMLAALLYAALAGFAISTQRALLMLVIFSISRLAARPISLLQVLLLTASLILLFDPFSILDQGFWLSFAAVLVIALSVQNKGFDASRGLDPPQKIGLLRLQPRLWLGLMPLSALLFGQVSLISPLVNLVMVPIFCVVLIPLTLLSIVLLNTIATAAASVLLELLASIYTWLFAQLQHLADLPSTIAYTAEISSWQLVGFVALIVSYLCHLKLRYGVLVCCIASLFLFKPAKPDKELHVSLFDVGQGLSMLLRVGDYTLLYDTGPRYRSGFTTANAVVLPYLRRLGVKEIDDLIISHADNDHIGGYQAVVDALSVKRIISSRQDKLPTSQACVAGMSWQVAHSRFTFLSPQQDTPKGSNNWSCVLMVEHAGQKVLITGDIEKQVERFLVENNNELNADLMLVPHQGSKTSSTPAFIDAVNPSLAVVAAGYQNHYGHPHPTIMKRYQDAGINVLSTIEHGTIEIAIDQNGMVWNSYRTKNRRFWH